MKPTRQELAWLLASWLFWAFIALHIDGAAATLYGYKDHSSHNGCAELFVHYGFQIWDHKPADFCYAELAPKDRTFSEDADCISADVCGIPDGSGARPLCVNWQSLGPQGYPPGLILLSLPFAWLYENVGLSFHAVNVVTILEYLVFAHLLFWMLFRVVFRSRTDDELPGGAEWERANPWLRLGLFGFVYLLVLRYTLTGFYDPIAVFALFAGIYQLARRKPVDALLAFSAALFLHYRALWYAPLVAVAALRSIPALRSPSRSTLLKLAAAAVMLGLFLYSLFLIFPFLKHWPDANPVAWRHRGLWKAPDWDLLLPTGLLFLYLAWGRHWLMLLTMAWQLGVISSTRQIMDWHVLFVLPMLALARLDEEPGVLLAAAICCLVQAGVVFKALWLPGDMIAAIANQWVPLF